MLWVRTRFIAANTSRGCSNSRPTTSGARNCGDDVPDGFGGLTAVVRMALGNRFAPPFVPVALHPRQDEVAVVGAAEARLEKVDERQAAQEQFQSVDSHRVSRRVATILQYTRAGVAFHYLAVEGPIGVGKTVLAERLASRLDATTILEDADNPFLADFYTDRPGAALQAQLFYLLNRHRQLTGLRQADLFLQATVCDYLFDKDKIFAYLNLDDNELFIYQRLFDLLARDVPAAGPGRLPPGADRGPAGAPAPPARGRHRERPAPARAKTTSAS